MGYAEENTVPAEKQLTRYFYADENPEASEKILFVGNSITLHDVKPEIGWLNFWGMAASAEEKDYVHLLKQKLSEKKPGAVSAVLQVAAWERNWTAAPETFETFGEARAWQADRIVARFSENTPPEGLDERAYAEAVVRFLRWLDGGEKAKFLVTDGFWPSEKKDTAMFLAAQELGAQFVSLRDLGTMDEMKAIGLFTHTGVAAHPGDRGMEEIARRIWSTWEADLG